MDCRQEPQILAADTWVFFSAEPPGHLRAEQSRSEKLHLRSTSNPSWWKCCCRKNEWKCSDVERIYISRKLWEIVEICFHILTPQLKSHQGLAGGGWVLPSPWELRVTVSITPLLLLLHLEDHHHHHHRHHGCKLEASYCCELRDDKSFTQTKIFNQRKSRQFITLNRQNLHREVSGDNE